MKKTVEYVWIDGTPLSSQVRSKTRVLDEFESPKDWNFDGGSTYQGTLEDSDVILHPVRTYRDPFQREGENFIALCEVRNTDSTPHSTNFRAELETQCNLPVTKDSKPLFGFEQEYTLISPIGPLSTENPTQAYCGVGKAKVKGRELAEAHLQACMYAGIGMYGINAEVLIGQWEFQTSPMDPLRASDDLWIARYILERLSEDVGNPYSVSFAPKPVAEGNGAGCHTNFSTWLMRHDIKHIYRGIEKLEWTHMRHLLVYGYGNKDRLTGTHETSSYDEFTYGESNRGCSVRIPNSVVKAGKGYFEDRRPAANCDPYLVTAAMLRTVCLENSLAEV